MAIDFHELTSGIFVNHFTTTLLKEAEAEEEEPQQTIQIEMRKNQNQMVVQLTK